MKKNFLSILMAAAFLAPAVLMTSCKDDDKKNEPGEPGVVVVIDDSKLSGSITGTKTLVDTVEYLLDGPLIIEDGGTLTIPAGTTIKAKKGFSSYILVLQGGKINVNGTAAKPVTMTSGATNPEAGDWGGLIINGYAPLTRGDDGKSQIGSTEINSAYTYGGEIENDNSGSITYLILAYTGARSSADVEHNGLTLNGVGSGTKIENIYIPNGADDGIEFFGGAVNVTNLLVVNSDDDMFDVTQGWSGTLKNCYGIWETGYTSTEADPRGVEADGNHDGNYPHHTRQANFRIENMTIDLQLNPVAADLATTNPTEFLAKTMQDVIKIRRGAKATIVNAVVKGTGTAVDLIDMTDSKGAGDPSSAISLTNALTNPITGKTVNYNATQLYDDVHAFGDDISKLKIEAGNTGCPADIFSWTGYKF